MDPNYCLLGNMVMLDLEILEQKIHEFDCNFREGVNLCNAVFLLASYSEDFENSEEEKTRTALNLLLSNGANLEERNAKLDTPVMISCFSSNEVCLEFLLEHGCDPNHVNCIGMTAAMAAAMRGNVSCLVLLQQHGADFLKIDSFGFSAAHYAIKFDQVLSLHYLL